MKKVFEAVGAGLLLSAAILGGMALLLGPMMYISSHFGFREGIPYTVGWIFFVLTVIYSVIFYFGEKERK